jgi:hypothetical protein
MHRSGTSAVCAALAASGVSFGTQLIDPIAGVNDEGFWEDARVVELNDRLLALTQSTWFAPTADIANIDWGSPLYDSLREQAAHILKVGFGASSPQAVKDPRLCLTLPFWLDCCAKLGISIGVCVVSRAPLEVARSLAQRDAFPIGYSLRLYLLYRACLHKFLPTADTFHVRYDDLLLDPDLVIRNLAEKFQLVNVNTGITTAVRGELRHQFSDADSAQDGLDLAGCAESDLAELARDIEMRYPVESTLSDFANKFTLRGLELERIGQAHAIALATLDERDEQIREFDRRLSQLGDEHSHALQVLRDRDAEISRLNQRLDAIRALPGVRLLMKLISNSK